MPWVGGARIAAARQRAIRDAQESLAYLAEQTGGFAVLNTNDLADGLSRISNDVRDYYVIGYEPDQDTFAPQGKAAAASHDHRERQARGRAREDAQGVHRRERSGAAIRAADAGGTARSRGDVAVQRRQNRLARHESARILTRTWDVRSHGAAPRRASAGILDRCQRHQDGFGRSRRSGLRQRRRAGRHHQHGIRRDARARSGRAGDPERPRVHRARADGKAGGISTAVRRSRPPLRRDRLGRRVRERAGCGGRRVRALRAGPACW